MHFLTKLKIKTQSIATSLLNFSLEINLQKIRGFWKLNSLLVLVFIGKFIDKILIQDNHTQQEKNQPAI